MLEVTLDLINGERIIKTYDSLSGVKEELDTLSHTFFLENVVRFNIIPIVEFNMNLTLTKAKAVKLTNFIEELI